MIIQLNPVKWFGKKAATTPPVALPAMHLQKFELARSKHVGIGPTLWLSMSAKAVESMMANEFVTILQKIGSIFEKGLSEAVKYLPLASTLAGFLFPPAVAPLAAATTVADLLQNAVAEVEQKLAAQGNQNGTGAQKLATVLTIVTSSVTGLLADPTVAAELKKAGITVNTAYITNLVNAVVSFLNVQGVVTTVAA